MPARVLVVEGADTIRGMIEALVRARGFEVRSAASAARGLDEASGWVPDVVVVDVDLPGPTSGLEVCEKLRGLEIAVVVISGGDDEVKRQALAAGARAVFERPFSPLALLKELETIAAR